MSVHSGDPAGQSLAEVQTELARLRSRQTKILDIVSEWVWETDRDHRFIWISDKVEQITGIPAEWHYGKTRLELMAGVLPDKEIAEHRAGLDRHEPFSGFTYLRRGPDGNAWMETSGTPQFDDGGRFSGYMGTARDITEIVEAQRKADSANSLLSEVIESINASMSIWGPDGNLILCNRMHRETHADIPECLVAGTTFEAFLRARSSRMIFLSGGGDTPAESETWLQERVARHRFPGPTFELDFIDGRRHIITETKLSDGSVVISGVDVTDLKKSDEKFRDSQKLLTSVLDALPLSVTVIDRQGEYSFVNLHEADRWGHERDSMIGKRVYDILDPSISGAAEAQDNQVFETGEAIPNFEESMTINGQKFSTLIGKLPIKGAQGDVEAVCMIGLDITEQVRASQTLRKNSASYQRTLMLLPDAVYVTIDGVIVFSNKAANSLFGAPAERGLVDIASLDLFHREEWPAVRLDRDAMLQRDKAITKIRRRHVRLDGTEFQSENAAAAILWEGKRALIIVARDITEQIRVNEELMAARRQSDEANAAKSEFLASMSHEIRTPLNGILGMTSIMSNRSQTGENESDIATIRNSGNLLLTLLNDILDLSKIEAGKLELEEIDFDLVALLKSVSDLWAPKAAARGLRYIVNSDRLIAPVLKSDPTRIRQILFNYMSNALKFTIEGEVEVTVAQTLTADHKVVTRIDIRDTGEGIAPESLPRLFENFSQADSSVTRRHGGTGLGLAISIKLAEAMGGDAGVDSMLGIGSSFWFSITCPPGEMGATESATAMPVETGGRRRIHILVAEDNQVNQKVVGAMLGMAGHTYDIVGNGVEAVQAATEREYDLILMDVQMPEMDGITAMERIHGLPPPYGTAPIIILTANAMKGDRDDYLQAGADDYVSKPIQPDYLSAAMQRVCGANISVIGRAITASPVPPQPDDIGEDLANLLKDMDGGTS